MDNFQHYTKGQWSSANNGKTIIKSEDGYNTVYASNVIKCDTNMVYKWTVKINEMSGSYCVIGIDESNYRHKQTRFYCENDGSFHYGYYSYFGYKYDSNGDISAYSSDYDKGDTIAMKIDTETNTLSFAKNSQKITKAFDIKATKNGYSLAICAGYRNISFSILSFTKCNKNRNEIETKSNESSDSKQKEIN